MLIPGLQYSLHKRDLNYSGDHEKGNTKQLSSTLQDANVEFIQQEVGSSAVRVLAKKID